MNERIQKVEKKIIKTGKLAIFKEGIQRKINPLTAELECLSVKSTVVEDDHVETRIEGLQKEIAVEGADDSVQETKALLERLQNTAQKLKTAINEKSPFIQKHVEDLQNLTKKELEARRKKENSLARKFYWNWNKA